MAKTLRVPDELRFVRAFALAVDPGDTLGLLMEIGALGSFDPSASVPSASLGTGRTGIGIVRRTREALMPAYDRASDLKDWEEAHTASVLREALAQSDSAVYLAYRVRDSHRAAQIATEASQVSLAEPYAEALAVVGCAADSLSSRRRPWEIEPDDLSLPEWQNRVWRLLREAMPDNTLPKPSEQPTTADAPCTCNEADSPKALSTHHAPWCAAHSVEDGP